MYVWKIHGIDLRSLTIVIPEKKAKHIKTQSDAVVFIKRNINTLIMQNAAPEVLT